MSVPHHESPVRACVAGRKDEEVKIAHKMIRLVRGIQVLQGLLDRSIIWAWTGEKRGYEGSGHGCQRKISGDRSFGRERKT